MGQRQGASQPAKAWGQPRDHTAGLRRSPTPLWNRTELRAENADGKRLERWMACLVLLVANKVEYGDDEPDETIRIISARRASRRERKRYEEERQKNYS